MPGLCPRRIEIAEQLRERDETPDGNYLPFGTGGIFTALTLALHAGGVESPLVGISVNRDLDGCLESFRHWWQQLTALLDLELLPPDNLEIRDEFVGLEYGDPTSASLDAILTMARTEAILLDQSTAAKPSQACSPTMRRGDGGSNTPF